jgi:hypothetical protein
MKKTLSCSFLVLSLIIVGLVFGGMNDRFSPIELTDIPNATSGTDIVTLTATQTLTNKTLTSPTISGAVMSTPVLPSFYQDAARTKLMTVPNVTSDTLAVIGAQQTLALKTLTTPVIASMYQDANKTQLMSLPNTTSDTLVGLAANQALTNKTLTAPVITSPDLTFGITSKLSMTKSEFNLGYWTLSAAEAASTVLVVSSGSTGGTFSIIAPATTGKPFIVRVEQGSPQLATVYIRKTAGVGGIAVAVGKTAMVFYDGVDYRRITADATNSY